MSRNISGLKAPVRRKLAELKDLAKEKGIEFIVTGTLRTEAEQFAYFAQGRERLEEVNRLRSEAGLSPITEKENLRTVTSTLKSAHLEGRAFDLAIVEIGSSRKGKSLIWNPKADVNKNQIPDYLELGKLAESIGLAWGGRFRSRDYVHFEFRGEEIPSPSSQTLLPLRGRRIKGTYFSNTVTLARNAGEGPGVRG